MAEVSVPERDLNQHINLIGVRNTERLDTYFASSMVDVASVVEITSNAVKVVPDVGIDLSKQEDAGWLMEIVQIALSECDEAEVTVEVHVEQLTFAVMQENHKAVDNADKTMDIEPP